MNPPLATTSRHARASHRGDGGEAAWYDPTLFLTAESDPGQQALASGEGTRMAPMTMTRPYPKYLLRAQLLTRL